MGATYSEKSFNGKLTKEELKVAFKSYQDACAYESGHSYSGQLNMCEGLKIEDEAFESYEEASRYLDDTVVKWENAIAVKTKDHKGREIWLVGGCCSC